MKIGKKFLINLQLIYQEMINVTNVKEK